MLLLASESSARARNVNSVVRELSLIGVNFADAVSLDRQLRGKGRRIVLLAQDELTIGVATVLQRRRAENPFGLIIIADRETLRSAGQDELLGELDQLTGAQWLSPEYRRYELLRAARECRQQLLKISRECLQTALTEKQFSLRYQPKVIRSDGSEWQTAEAEALLRWDHPEHGRVGPLDFIPELEAFDLMPAVSEFVLDEAASQLSQWDEKGLKLDACINLASSQLSDAGLADAYARIVRERGLECSRFTFEVIERDIADTSAPHRKVLNDLRDKGFRISLDHFDIAAASLGTLEALPVDEIKIPARALTRARHNPVARQVLAAVTGLAHNLGISVCAEGVEDRETYEFLNTIDCDKLQGYLISEAVMPDLIQSGYAAEQVEVEAVA